MKKLDLLKSKAEIKWEGNILPAQIHLPPWWRRLLNRLRGTVCYFYTAHIEVHQSIPFGTRAELWIDDVKVAEKERLPEMVPGDCINFTFWVESFGSFVPVFEV